jgi:hypothetical protein
MFADVVGLYVLCGVVCQQFIVEDFVVLSSRSSAVEEPRN